MSIATQAQFGGNNELFRTEDEIMALIAIAGESIYSQIPAVFLPVLWYTLLWACQIRLESTSGRVLIYLSVWHFEIIRRKRSSGWQQGSRPGTLGVEDFYLDSEDKW